MACLVVHPLPRSPVHAGLGAALELAGLAVSARGGLQLRVAAAGTTVPSLRDYAGITPHLDRIKVRNIGCVGCGFVFCVLCFVFYVLCFVNIPVQPSRS